MGGSESYRGNMGTVRADSGCQSQGIAEIRSQISIDFNYQSSSQPQAVEVVETSLDEVVLFLDMHYGRFGWSGSCK